MSALGYAVVAGAERRLALERRMRLRVARTGASVSQAASGRADVTPRRPQRRAPRTLFALLMRIIG